MGEFFITKTFDIEAGKSYNFEDELASYHLVTKIKGPYEILIYFSNGDFKINAEKLTKHTSLNTLYNNTLINGVRSPFFKAEKSMVITIEGYNYRVRSGFLKGTSQFIDSTMCNRIMMVLCVKGYESIEKFIDRLLLPHLIIPNETPRKDCPVCLEKMKRFLLTPCDHKICAICYYQLPKKCPLCNTSL